MATAHDVVLEKENSRVHTRSNKILSYRQTHQNRFLVVARTIQAGLFTLKSQMREFPADDAQDLFERVVVTIAISTAVALTVTPGIRAPELSVTLPVTVANPP